MSPEEEAATINGYFGMAAPAQPAPPGPNMSLAPSPTSPNMSVPDPASYYGQAPTPQAPPTPPPTTLGAINSALPAIAQPIGGFGAGAPAADPFGIGGGTAPPTTPATVKLSPAAESAMTKQANSNIPTGPSAADNAAFDAFKAGQSSMPKAPAAQAGVGGGGGGGGNSLQKNVNDANRALLGTYDAEKDATRQEGNIKSAHDVILAQRQQELSRLQQEDAAIANSQEQHAQDIYESHLNEVQSQLADVRSQKIDPMAWKKGSDAMPFVVVLGGLLGGLYMGATHQASNPFMTELNQEIDRSIKVQQDNIDNGRNAALDNLNLLQTQRAVFKDHQLADLNTRNLYYEAAKTQLVADAADTDSQLAKSEADKGIALVSRAQDMLQKQIAEHALQVAQSQAAAAAAQAREAQKFRIETQLKLIELGIKEKEADAKSGNKSDEQMQKLGQDLSKPELVDAMQTIADIKKKVMKVGPNGQEEYDLQSGVPGVGPLSDARSRLRPKADGTLTGTAGVVSPGAWAINGIAGLSPDERMSRQEWERLALAYKHAVTGAGGSDKEAEGIMGAFSGASTPAEQANAIRLADETLSRRQARIKASYDGDLVKKYEGRESDEHSRATATSTGVHREAVK